jgi:hypothetical protein
MTDQEKEAHYKQKILKIAAEKKNVAFLESKIESVGKVLSVLSERLLSEPEGLWRFKTRAAHLEVPVLPPFDDSEIEDAVDLDRIFRLCDDMRKSRAELRSLELSKSKIDNAC